MKRMNFVIACFNMSFTKLEIRHFHGQSCSRQQKNVQKSVMHMQSCCLALSSYQLFQTLNFSSLPHLNYDPSKTEYSRGKFNIIALADSNQNVFSTHQQFLCFWLGKQKIKVSFVCTSLVNEPSNCGKTIAVVYELTKRMQEKLFADQAQ